VLVHCETPTLSMIEALVLAAFIDTATV